MYQRRDFLKTTVTGIALTAISGEILGCKSSSLFGSGNIKEFGLQLYTLRDVLPKDPKGILKQVAVMGYKQIESYPHDELGMFWGMKNTEFKKYVDDLGMQFIASHAKIMKDFEAQADQAAEIGMKYLICGSFENEKGMDKEGYIKTADLFNKKGEICKSRGLKFAYHNHDQIFIKNPAGFVPQEILLQNTDPSFVDFEMDIYWVVTAGQDPVKWIEKYPNRFKLCHIKDRKKNTPLNEREVSVNLGDGSIDFKKILKVAKENGMKYYIVEQEKYEGTTPLDAAKAGADYLRKLKI
ncbi:MAG: sugar phosphate isomerase/epimerase [Ginsengibacter sp.]